MSDGAKRALSNYSARAASIDTEVMRRLEIERTIAIIRSYAKQISDALRAIKTVHDELHDELKNLEDEKLAIDQGQLILD